jgi:hypothetical protein
VYVTNSDIKNCKSFIPALAFQFHKRNFDIAINMDNEFNKDIYLNEERSGYKFSEYVSTFEQDGQVDDWINYIVIDNAFDFFDYKERRELVASLRDVFKKAYIGFRYDNSILLNPISKHPQRVDRTVNDFLPKEDDGDFIITQKISFDFVRTAVIVMDPEIKGGRGIDGEFVK